MPPTEDVGPEPDPRREVVLDALVEFVRRLRDAGVTVPPDAALQTAEALATVDAADRPTVEAVARATLCTRAGDLAVFERLFPSFWRDLREENMAPAGDGDPSVDPVQQGTDDSGPADSRPGGQDGSEPRRTRSRDGDGDAPRSAESVAGDPVPGESSTEVSGYSPGGDSSRVKRAGVPTDHDLSESVARLSQALGTTTGRRRTPTPSGPFVDARSALRTSVATGGVPVSLPETEATASGARGVVLVDVSQSVLDCLDRRFVLAWLRHLHDEFRSLRVFFFDTDLREVTGAFDERTVGDVFDALRRVEAAWGGGTRIGHALETVARSYPDAVDHRTAVFVLSDGLERGEVARLEAAAAALSRRARVFLWLNPLAKSPAYEPTARGMAAALPALDGLFAFAGPEDVSELARQLEYHDPPRLGYRYDPRRGDGAATDAGPDTPDPDRPRGPRGGRRPTDTPTQP